MEPSTVQNVVISYATHDRYGIMLSKGEYLPVTASDWKQFSLDMALIILAETAEISRIKHNIEKIRQIDSLIASMESERYVKSDDDWAHKSDDVESEMDHEYIEDYDDRYTSGFFSFKEGELESLTKLVESFYNAVCSEVEDIDGSTYTTIKDRQTSIAYQEGIKAIRFIAERCELQYSYKLALRDMPQGMIKRMPKD